MWHGEGVTVSVGVVVDWVSPCQWVWPWGGCHHVSGCGHGEGVTMSVGVAMGRVDVVEGGWV